MKVHGGIAAIMVGLLLIVGCTKEAENPGNAGSDSKVQQVEQETALNPDDQSETVPLHLIGDGWLNTPRGDDDPIQKWIDERFNIQLKFENVPGADLDNKLALQFSSNQPPDLIYTTNKNSLKKMYSQGVLIDDWTPYLQYLPNLTANFNSLSQDYATVDGKIAMLPIGPRANNFGYMIRKDWLNNLGLSMPTNDAELLEVLRQFTNNDPDQNGKKDTWGISSAGGSQNIGEIANLAGMYGPTGFYIENGEVNHPILDGNHKRFLDFIKQVVDEGLMDPEWYTQGWEQRKPKLFSGSYGVAWYPPMDIVAETAQYTENQADPYSMWGVMPYPKADEKGGKRPPASIASGMYSISKAAAEDPVKLSRLLKLLNDVQYPSDDYFAIRWGVGIPGVDNKLEEFGDGLRFMNSTHEGRTNFAWVDWGSWIATNDNVYMNGTDLDEAYMGVVEMDTAVQAMPSYDNIEQLVNFDLQAVSDADQARNEFEISYILGNDTDYDAFRERWLKRGGQILKDQVAEQVSN